MSHSFESPHHLHQQQHYYHPAHHQRSCSSSSPLTISAPSLVSLPSSLPSSSGMLIAHHRCDELRKRIHENHLSYLNMDETPAKLETRTKIECLIAEYLALVPNASKFGYEEVAICLTHSIQENKDFSAYKAALAFEALEKYATNLITQPWRKEYRMICPFGGFYRHVIQKNLIDADNILFLMGYEYNQVKNCFEISDVPIDPDKVSRVSLECLVAFVELQIMIQIRDSVRSKGYNDCTWKEIYSIREEYVCGQGEVIKLICEKRKTAKLIDYDGGSPKTKKLVPQISNLWSSNGLSLLDDKSPDPNRHPYHDRFDYVYNDDKTNNRNDKEFIDFLNHPVLHHQQSFPLPLPCHYCMPHSNSLPIAAHSSYGTSAIVNPFPVSIQSLPTHLPIYPKVQTASKAIQAEFDEVDSIKKSLQANQRFIAENGKATSSRKEISLNRSRGDSASLKSEKRTSFYDNLDPLNSLDIGIGQAKLTDSKSLEPIDKKLSSERKSPAQERTKQSSLEKKKQSSLETKKGVEKEISIGSRFVNSIKPTVFKNLPDKQPESKSTIATVVASTPLSVSTGSKLPAEEMTADKNEKQSTESNKRWSCTTCTYLNDSNRDVCEICHRSRRCGNEATPLIIGGRECPRCTLVNRKDEKFCTACDTSLAYSPTYI